MNKGPKALNRKEKDEVEMEEEYLEDTEEDDSPKKTSAEIVKTPKKRGRPPKKQAETVRQVSFSLDIAHVEGPNGSVVVCRNCNPAKKFATVPELVSHHFAKHAQVWSYDCAQCSSGFDSSEKLWAHKNVCKSNEPPAKVAKISPTSDPPKKRGRPRIHPVKETPEVKTVSNEEHFMCGPCKLSFPLEKRLRSHLRSSAHLFGVEMDKANGVLSLLREAVRFKYEENTAEASTTKDEKTTTTSEIIILGSGQKTKMGAPKRAIFQKNFPKITIEGRDVPTDNEHMEFEELLEKLPKSEGAIPIKAKKPRAKKSAAREVSDTVGCRTGNSFRISINKDEDDEITDVTCLECFTLFKDMEDYYNHSEKIRAKREGDTQEDSHTEAEMSGLELDHSYYIPTEAEEKQPVKRGRGRPRKGTKSKSLCPKCGDTVIILKAHLKTCQKPKMFRYTCKLCKFGCGEMVKMQTHSMKMHSEKVFRCPVCKVMLYDNEISGHFEEKHDGMEYYKYNRDLRVDKAKHELAMHKLRTLHQKYECICNYCGKKLFNKGSLRDHIISAHTFEYPYSCECCNIKFTKKHLFHLHLQKHQGGPKNFPCPHCDRKFSLSRKRHTHISQKHGETMPGGQCEFCRCGFIYKDGLKKHMSRFPNGTCMPVCRICNKQVLRAILPRHERSHSDARFQCTLCPRSFVRGYMLNDHYDTHSELKRFKCDKCNKGYFTNAQLLAHRSTKHYVEVKEGVKLETFFDGDEVLEEWLEDEDPEVPEGENTDLVETPPKVDELPVETEELADETGEYIPHSEDVPLVQHVSPNLVRRAEEKLFEYDMAMYSSALRNRTNNQIIAESSETVDYEEFASEVEWLDEEEPMLQDTEEPAPDDPETLALLSTLKPTTGAVVTKKMTAYSRRKNHPRTSYFIRLENGDYRCGECSFTRSEKHYVYVHHYNRHRVKNKIYTCEHCPFQSSQYVQFLKHRQKHKTKHDCDVCSKVLPTKEKLWDHQNVHTGSKPHECQYCMATFSARANLLAHQGRSCKMIGKSLPGKFTKYEDEPSDLFMNM